MAHKIFVSYKYADSLVYQDPDLKNNPDICGEDKALTPRHYLNAMSSILSDEAIEKWEPDGVDVIGGVCDQEISNGKGKYPCQHEGDVVADEVEKCGTGGAGNGMVVILVVHVVVFFLVYETVRLGDFRLEDFRRGDIRLGDVRLGDVRLGDVRLGDSKLGDVRL